jgi:hypothetical protein
MSVLVLWTSAQIHSKLHQVQFYADFEDIYGVQAPELLKISAAKSVRFATNTSAGRRIIVLK